MSDEEFQLAINILVDKMSVEQLADELLVSLPTIRRWSEGKNLPRRMTRQGIASYFRKKIRND